MIDPSLWPVLRKLSPRQYEAIAYLVAGGWNTVFGVGLYTVLYALFGNRVHYLILASIVQIAAITNAFLCYKLFVFRTKGNWVVEYLRCYLVYGVGAVLSMMMLFVFVECLHVSPVLANVISTILVIVLSFFGHKFFSFKRK